MEPVKQGGPEPIFDTALGGNAVHVTFADGRVDTVALLTKPETLEVDGQKASGAALIFTKMPGHTTTATTLEP